MRVAGIKTGFIAAAIAVLLGCVTEPVPQKPTAAAAVPAIDPVVLAVQQLVMQKAIGGLRDMDQAALDESGWPAGIEEGRRVRENPARYVSRGLYRDLVGQHYRIRYFLEKSADRRTTQTASTPPAAQSAPTTQTAAAPAPPPKSSAEVTSSGEKIYILVTVPAAAGAAPLVRSAPYVFVVATVAGRLQITNSDFIPDDYMAGLDDKAILEKLLKDI